MKIQSNSKIKNKKILVVFVLLFTVLVGAGVWWYLNETNGPKREDTLTTEGIDYGPPSDEQKKTGDEIKRNNVDVDAGDEKPASSDKNTVTVTISSPDIESGQTLSVRAFIDRVIGDGTCTLQLTKTGSAAVVQKVGVQPMANTTACKLADIPTTDMAKGIWTVSVAYENKDQKGSAKKEITIK